MKKHIDLRPSGIVYTLRMEFKIIEVLFSKHVWKIVKLIYLYHKVSKRLGLVPRTKIILGLPNFDIKIENSISEPIGLERIKLKTFLRFCNPPKVTQMLHAGQIVDGSHF